MNTRAIATQYRMSQWSQIMRERAASGESIRSFCQRRGISKNMYFYWQKKLREAACKELLPAAKSSASTEGAQAVVPKGWAICESHDSTPGNSGIVIEIGNFRVKVDAGTDSEHIEKVCRVLMSLC